MSFKDLGLTEKTIQAINDLGYETPLPRSEMPVVTAECLINMIRCAMIL